MKKQGSIMERMVKALVDSFSLEELMEMNRFWGGDEFYDATNAARILKEAQEKK